MDPRLDLAIKQIEFAREYTLTLLEGLDESDWFAMPAGVSHVAWQVGHLAMAEYGLALFRQRGRRPEDGELMSSRFRKAFGRGSTPAPSPEENPSPDEIRAVFDKVHRAALDELPQLASEHLDEPVDMPYAAYPIKLGALLFCSHHEFLHAGQIGLLRRQMGKEPLR